MHTIEETNHDQRECTKIELLPYYDFEELPFAMSITQKGLQLINVRQRKIYTFIDGVFKDFAF